MAPKCFPFLSVRAMLAKSQSLPHTYQYPAVRVGEHLQAAAEHGPQHVVVLSQGADGGVVQAATHVKLDTSVMEAWPNLVTLTYWLGLPFTMLPRSLVVSTSASAMATLRLPSSEILVSLYL